MDVRYAVSKKEYSRMNTEELRENFIIQNIFEADKINLTYSHIDRIIAGGACPARRLSLSSQVRSSARIISARDVSSA